MVFLQSCSLHFAAVTSVWWHLMTESITVSTLEDCHCYLTICLLSPFRLWYSHICANYCLLSRSVLWCCCQVGWAPDRKVTVTKHLSVATVLVLYYLLMIIIAVMAVSVSVCCHRTVVITRVQLIICWMRTKHQSLKASQPTWTASLLSGCYRPHAALPFIVIS